MPNHVGFTGTRKGMSPAQKRTLKDLLQTLKGKIFHHGLCVGADEQAHRIARKCGYECHVHPPTDKKLISTKCEDARFWSPKKSYKSRNQNIVDSSNIVIVAPKGYKEELRSGTWMTYRYAVKRNVKTIVIWPDGSTSLKEILIDKGKQKTKPLNNEINL